MVAADMADALKAGLGFGALSTSAELVGFATALIDHMGLSGLVNHAPGTVVGVCPAGGPISDGAATGGLVVGLSGPTLAALMQVEMGKPSISPELLGLADAITTHLLAAFITFSPGSITGTCTNTAVSPGPFVGEGTGGFFVGLVGPTLAALAATGIGQPAPSPELLAFCTELTNYITANAEVTYLTGTVTGTAPAGGGPLTAGAGVGGTIS